jgi:hypothetical protein
MDAVYFQRSQLGENGYFRLSPQKGKADLLTQNKKAGRKEEADLI